MKETPHVKLDQTKSVDANSFARRVEKKAYEFYVIRGYRYGHDWNDWFEAEKIVEAEINSVDKDCIRSERFFKDSHRSISLPSGVDLQKINTSPFVNNF